MKKKLRRISILLTAILIFQCFLIPSITHAEIKKSDYQASKDFSTVQGQNNWYYMERTSTGSYKQMTWNSERNYWNGSNTWCVIGQTNLHPDENDSVRKWVAPYSGTIIISANGNIRKFDTSGGDGVKVSVSKNNKQLWAAYIAATDGVGIKFPERAVDVNAGDEIYFTLNKNQNNSCDGTIWDPIISYTSPLIYQASKNFSTVQGQNNWYYMERTSTGSYKQMTWNSERNYWNGSSTWCVISQTNLHPDENDSVRKWVAPYSGTIIISADGNIRKFDTTGGDGINVSVSKNDERLWNAQIAGTDGVGIKFPERVVDVNAGDEIYFTLNKNQNNYNDGTIWDPMISYTDSIIYQASEDFSTVQGQNNWYYMEKTSAGNYNYMTWKPDRNGWFGSNSWCFIGANSCLHPDENDSVRKWVAPYNGTIIISADGNIRKYDTTGGDGINVSVSKNDERLWNAQIAGTDGVGIKFPEKAVDVNTGDEIYFTLNKNQNNSYDASIWDPIIIYKTILRRPSIIVNSPSANDAFSEAYTNFIPRILVYDVNGNPLTCKYYIDSETTPRDTKTISTTSEMSVEFNSINIGSLSEGSHTIKYEINDGNVNTPITQTVGFIVDKSVPTLGTVTSSSTVNTISISGSATDNLGLDANPYRYTVGSVSSPWGSATTYTSSNNLISGMEYLVKLEARDRAGHITIGTKNIYTKAAVPVLTVSNASSYTLDVAAIDNNSSAAQYQISINNGSQYVTQEGNLTAAPAWITLSSKKVTVKGLTPNSTYTFSAKAKNGENIETMASAAVTGTTLAAPPGSPANIIATATDKTITVSWDAVNGAVGYDIEADGVTINNGTSTTYTNINLNPGTPHKYRVRAKNAGGPGNWSVEISKSTLPGSPDIPQNLNTIPLSTSVTVTWNNVPGATGYDIEVDGVLVNNGPATSYIHNSLTPGTHHSYRVRSINPGGKSEWSSYVNTTTLVDSIQVPVNITATPSLNKIALSWDPVDGASGYDIQVDEQTFDNSNRTTYTHSNLIPGTQHIYKVRAKKGGKNSEWSSIVVSSTLANAFGIPANFKANAEDTSVTLIWDAVPEAEGYDVEIDGVITDNAMETSCIHKGLIPDSSHTYRVRARKAANSSDWTQPLTVKTYKLQTPQNITAVSDETSITINWNPVNGATSYDIEIDGSIVSGIAGIQSLQTTTNSAITTTGEVISTATFTTGSAITAAENQVLPATYTITGLTPNTLHTMKVRAVNESGTSGWSTPLTQSTRIITGNTPNVSGVAKKSSITVMWNAMDGASAYEVEVDGEVTTNVTGTTFNSTGLAPGTQHSYRVRAQNGSGAGDWSSPFTVSTLPEGPATPTNFAASGNMTSILVTWDKVAGAEEYEIEADGVVINTGTGTSYLHTGLTPDTSHKYRVRAKNISSFSEWSETKSVNTLSSVQTYQIESTSGEEFDLVLTANNIQDLDKYTFTIQYNTDDFEVMDLCGLTAKTDTVEGDISGTDITVKQLAPGTIVFTKTGSAQSWQVWSGVVNSITFKGKKDGNSAITYTIQ